MQGHGLGLANTAEITLLGAGSALLAGQVLKVQFLNIMTIKLLLPFYG